MNSFFGKHINKIKRVVTVLRSGYRGYGHKVILLTILGIINSFLEGIGIAALIPVFILKMPVATVSDLAQAVISIVKEKNNITKDIPVEIIGAKVGERKHEKLLTLDEAENALEREDMYIIRPNVKYEIFHDFKPEEYTDSRPAEIKEYSSQSEKVMSLEEIKKMILSVEGMGF